MTVGGNACAGANADSECAGYLTAAVAPGNTIAQQTATVTATYPCNLTILGVVYANPCTMTSQVAQIVQ
jgi:hypothetical protein